MNVEHPFGAFDRLLGQLHDPFRAGDRFLVTGVGVAGDTDAGVVGWGEAYSQYDRDRAIVAQVEELGRYLIGRELVGG